LLMTGEPITAADACRWGLINQVVAEGPEKGSVLDAALALAARITVNAPLSVQASKRIAYGVDDGVIADEEPGWQRTVREMRTVLKSEDAREGPLAFAEKRDPVWKAR
ncbi:enoyl-CoA hydratase-related protein, partial [Mycobacterium sp. Lab-001]|uniref:enoyl-CoA hydratase-related protein n=1 Tax=Mycobacterium sp. Lab-001 TaxID=3410136 RepID=UPI003D16A899